MVLIQKYYNLLKSIKEAIIQISPRESEYIIYNEDFEELISKEGDSIALILLGTSQFLTGQAFDMNFISKKGHEKDIVVGYNKFLIIVLI
jgi:kynureninase